MTLAEATSRFLDYAGQKDSTVHPRRKSAVHAGALLLLTTYFSPQSAVTDITPSSLRDFLSRWYVEKACASKASDSNAAKPAEPNQVPEPRALLNSLAEFFKWTEQQARTGQASQFSSILIELRSSLPRAMNITHALSSSLRERGGAFNFPEFLTSFEEGGSSQYDIDVPGNIGAIDGYFRITRVEGSSIEAEELISEELVWPIVFPTEAAALLDAGYIVNLELVRKSEGWQIAGCGFAYPPGTEIG